MPHGSGPHAWPAWPGADCGSEHSAQTNPVSSETMGREVRAVVTPLALQRRNRSPERPASPEVTQRRGGGDQNPGQSGSRTHLVATLLYLARGQG